MQKNYLHIIITLSNPRYIFYNVNPLGLREQDCVIRAICLALEKPYLEIISLVDANGNKYLCDNLNVDCYSRLLEEYFGLKRKYGNGKKVWEVAEDNPDKTLIIRIDGHLTAAKNKIIFDIWDCTNEEVDIYWIVEK